MCIAPRCAGFIHTVGQRGAAPPLDTPGGRPLAASPCDPLGRLRRAEGSSFATPPSAHPLGVSDGPLGEVVPHSSPAGGHPLLLAPRAAKRGAPLFDLSQPHGCQIPTASARFNRHGTRQDRQCREEDRQHAHSGRGLLCETATRMIALPAG